MIKIRKNVPLAPFTTFKIGGPAKYFCQIEKEEELLEAIKYACGNKLEFFVLAGGSNILVSDKGFNGLVIRVLDAKCRVLGVRMECGAGLQLSEAVKLAAKNSLSGLEWAAGIPGTVGGAVRGNAGAYGSDMSFAVESVKVLRADSFDKNQKSKIFTSENCGFGYRHSVFKKNRNLIILSCVLKLQKGNKAEIERKMKEIIIKRADKLPKDSSAGSLFQNPIVKNPELIARFEREAKSKCHGGRIPTGWLIDELDLRGKKIGGVMVSEKHANFVVNLGQGKAQDVVALASYIKQQVRDNFGIQLKEEVQYVGF